MGTQRLYLPAPTPAPVKPTAPSIPAAKAGRTVTEPTPMRVIPMAAAANGCLVLKSASGAPCAFSSAVSGFRWFNTG